MAITKLPRSGIADDAINADKIEDGTIQATEITGTVSASKLSSTTDLSSKTVTLPNTSVTSDMLVNTTIANAKLSNSAITVRGTSRSLGSSFSLGVDVDWQSVKTGDTTMIAGQGYFVNTTSGAVTMTLPSSASRGDTIAIKDYAATFGSNNLTIARNGHNIQGNASNSTISTNRASIVLVYIDSTKGWLYTTESNVADLQTAVFITATGGTITESGNFKIHTFTGDGCFVVTAVGSCSPRGDGPAVADYLVVAGGGGGGGFRAGGAGGGGFRESHSNPVSGPYTASPLATPTGITLSAQTYPISVGAGGSGGSGCGSPGTNGSNSVFSTITSAGGGGGGAYDYPSGDNGLNGGSGGGGGAVENSPTPNSAGSGNTPPVSPPQGQNGGSVSLGPVGGGNSGAGGGGAGGTGASTQSNTQSGGAGGNGVASSITGSPVTRSGGGGGGAGPGSLPGGAGGTGGAGNGGGGPGAPPTTGVAGTANTGGGGGGSGNATTGGAGGKGIVVIRYKFQ